MEAKAKPPNSIGAEHDEAVSALWQAFEKVNAWLQDNTAEIHKYRIVSSTEGLAALDEFCAWEERGHSGKSFRTDPPKWRAVIFQLGRANADLQAYRAVCALVSREYIDAALPLLR